LFEGVYAFTEYEKEKVNYIVSGEKAKEDVKVNSTIIINGQIYK
jgi:hypothetical protein